MERESQDENLHKAGKGKEHGMSKRQANRSMRGSQDSELSRVIEYEVMDHYDNKVGTVSALWHDQSKDPAFVGIETGKLFGKTHIVPALDVHINHGKKRMKMPYTTKEIEGAPSYDSETELTSEIDREVRQYFRSLGEVIPEEGEKGDSGKRSSMERRDRGGDRVSRRNSGEQETRMPLHEEKLKVGKKTSEGGVRLRKVVHDEEVHKPVRIRREDIEIERVSGAEMKNQNGASRGQAFDEGEDVFIPLRSEEPVLEKETRVREEIRARKTGNTEERDVSGTVRKEDVEIEEEHSDKSDSQRWDDEKSHPHH